MKLKRCLTTVLALALSAAAAFTVTACGPKVIPNNTEGKTPINISLYGGGHGTAYMDVLIENFLTAHPDYAAEYYIDYDEEKLHAGLIQDELEAGYGETQMYVMSHNDFVHFIYSDYLEDLSDVAAMRVDGADKPDIKGKMVRYEEWQSIYSRNGQGLYALPYADSMMGFVYDHDLFVESNWYEFASEAEDGAALAEQGITYTVNEDGHLLFQSATGTVNYEVGDRILSAGKDDKYGTYDDGQPQTVEDWDAMIRKIAATNGSKAFISSGQIGSYATHIVSAFFAQYSGMDAFNTYFTYDSNGEKVKLANGEEVEITLENGYRVNAMEGVYKAYEFLSKYFDTRKSDPLVSLHPAVTDGTKNHMDTQNLFLLGYQQSATNPQSAMLLEGAWWEYEARSMFKTLEGLDADRGYGKREYRYMLLPDLASLGGKADGKSAISCCESGAIIVPKDSNKERLQVTKEFLAYMASDEAINIFLTMTGSIMPYTYSLTDEEYAELTPFTKNMIELYSDEEHVDVVRPQIAALYSPISYAGGRDNTYFLPKINGIAIDQPFKAVRENSLDAIRDGLAAYHSQADWQGYIERAQEQGFFNESENTVS